MKRILLVDDEPRVLHGLRRMLRPMQAQWNMVFLTSAEKALELLQQETVGASETAERVTVSGGVAVRSAAPWEDVVKEADDALYAAKDGGRNQVRVATGPRNTRTCARVDAGS